LVDRIRELGMARAWYGVGVAAASVVGAVALGQPAVDKGVFWLGNPTPRELMRELSTDRPDTTESPYTVDAGRFQVELSLVDYTRDEADGVRTRAVSVAPVLLKAGVTSWMDVALGLEPYTRVRVEDGSGAVTEDGFGDLVVRVKMNAWGNDGGRTALAVMPYVKLPTAGEGLGNDFVEGGLIVPFAVDLGAGNSLGLMAEFDVVRDAADEGYVVDFVHSATVSRPLAGDLGGYVEYAGFYSLNADVDYRAYVNAGVTYGLTADVQLDAGVRVGLTDAADDFGVFTGVSWRF
jgi:hypothetical protein